MDIGFWTNAKDSAHWKLNVPVAQVGKYTAKQECACDPGSSGSVFALLVDGVDSDVTGAVMNLQSNMVMPALIPWN